MRRLMKKSLWTPFKTNRINNLKWISIHIFFNVFCLMYILFVTVLNKTQL